MSRVRSKDTKPERIVRSLVHRIGYRFTINGPKNRNLPGKPDLVFPRLKTVLFVHGCFWHGHPGCPNHRIPKTRSAWWSEKIARNRKRDEDVLTRLDRIGWSAVVVWECELKDIPALTTRLRRALREAGL